MTKITAFDLTPFYRNAIGADRLFDRIVQQIDHAAGNNYPPYNIRKNDENSYTIELAVAGFGESEIDVTIDGGKLIVKGNVETNTDDAEENFLFKGIAARAFTRSFALNDQVEVKDAEIFNGMLKIALERMIPEEKKPTKVAVKSRGSKEFLND